MTKTPLSNRKAVPVLVFGNTKKLIAIYSSISAAARSMGVSPTNVLYACNGENISCKSHYFRTLDDSIEVTFDDFGTLKVKEYDDLCGVRRRYYKTSDMSQSAKKTKKIK